MYVWICNFHNLLYISYIHITLSKLYVILGSLPLYIACKDCAQPCNFANFTYLIIIKKVNNSEMMSINKVVVQWDQTLLVGIRFLLQQ